MTYNIRNCRGMDDSTNYSRIAQIIRNENPDVIALQELDSVTKRSKKIDVLNELVRQTGLSGIYSAAIDYERGKYGIGILSKEKPQKIYRKTLPGSEEKRTMLIAEFKHYVFINMHLSLTEQDRDASLPIIQQETKHFNKPVFIAGDWNTTPDSRFIDNLQNNFILLNDTSLHTFPANKPQQTIDYIALKKANPTPMTLHNTYVTNAPVESDHRPVIVVIKTNVPSFYQ